jgi:cell division septation protein DedD
MAVVVIAVGIFLMGLQVGRGVLTARGAPGAESAAAVETEPPPAPSAASSGSSTLPATAAEKLSYAERLGSAEPAKEQLRAEAAPAPAETPPTPRAETTAPVGPAAVPSAAKPATPAPASAAAAVSSEPAGAGFAIQVAALREREEADVIVKRLASKGYPAYVVAPAKGSPSVFRVRVGKYKDRNEADTIAARLQKEEQFKPWIVR